MATASALWYTASCDRCDQQLEHDDLGIVLDKTRQGIIEWALARDWLLYQGDLLCWDCWQPLTGQEHDFVTIEKTAPFCAICKQLPDAAHPNVPMLGQTAIGDPDA